MISKRANEFEFEAFELSPNDAAVMGSSGRLRRCFPGPSLCVSKDQFNDPDLQWVLAKTLSKLSRQVVSGITNPVVRGRPRDTHHPGLVTELLFSFLRTIAVQGNSKKIWKHTRQDVLCQVGGSPWRRSPLWMLIRVIMQTLFSRQADSDHSPSRDYKVCMLYILASVLDRALDLEEPQALAPDLLHCMSAKLVRRMLKLDPMREEPSISFVQDVIQRTKDHLEQKWSLIQLQNQGSLDLSPLTRLQFVNDVSITLPNLDEFVSSLATRGPSQPRAAVTITPGLQKFSSRAFPVLDVLLPSDYLPYNLEGFEGWVASHLRAWSERHRKALKTRLSIARGMKKYHAAAKTVYLGNPELTSVMILTLLELWIGCDKLAIQEFPLLRDYDPQIPLNVLQSLLLRTKDSMSRLQIMERYVTQRQEKAKFGVVSGVFRGFGTEESFSVRYFDTSAHLQDLHEKIQLDATRDRSEKLNELMEAKKASDRLMRLYHSGSCQTDTRKFNVLRGGNLAEESVLMHKEPCVRCSYKQEAEAMTIDVFEWPLPSDPSEAKSVVFELDVPQAFSSWRDSTMFLLMKVLGQEYAIREPVRHGGCSLSTYPALHSRYNGNGAQRFSLGSATLPNAPATVKVETSTLSSEICVENGLEFRYFDNVNQVYVRDLDPSDDVVKACTYQLPSQSSSLQQFVLRSFNETDSTSNDIIATQSSCPEHISLTEYRSLATIPVGYRLQWLNILVQLACPTLDIKKMETSLLVLQAIYQAGPPGTDDDGFRRASHSVVGCETFVLTMLTRTKEAAAKMESNWESFYALGIIVSIVSRILYLAPSSELKAEAVAFLAGLRKTACRWTQMLRDKCDESHNNSQKAELVDKLVSVALVCTGTFDVDLEHLKTILSDPTQASIFVKCGILIQEYGIRHRVGVKHSLSTIMHRRWQRLTCWAFPLLSAGILNMEASTCLDDAIQDQWQEFKRGPPWQSLDIAYWAVSKTGNQAGRQLPLHYNFLTGQLLVDGSPLSRLPSQYESHQTYQRLFGRNTFQVVPSCVPGMQFASKQPFSGHTLHFGFMQSTLLVHAICDGVSFDLVPSNLFRGTLPHALVNEFVHWYNYEAGTVEFREKEKPWTLGLSSWTLIQHGEVWRLSKQGKILVDPKSQTGSEVGAILEPLQQSLEMTFVITDDGQKLEIELPRLQLGFYLKQGTSCIFSREFKGYQIDSEQSVDTLIGLKNKLVLKASTGDDRRVLVPPGKVSFFREKDHVCVTIQTTSGSSHIYKVDETLGILRDNGCLHSKLQLIYLHGLTSFCLPDPLTSHTGTEQSLSILRGAAVRSFRHLTEKDLILLHAIQALTPRRHYHPRQSKVAQTVSWNPQLPTLSQHPLYHANVQDIFQQAEIVNIYYPDVAVKPPGLNSPDAKLLRRDAARTSAFRISSFGSEDCSEGVDVEYQSRDLNLDSKRAARALMVSTILFQRNADLHCRPVSHSELASHLLNKLKLSPVIKNAGPDELPADTLDYDGKYLTNHSSHWAGLWCWLHRQSQNVAAPKFEQFQLMMWFSTMAFDAQADVDMVHTAAYMFVLAELREVEIPSTSTFRLQQGNFNSNTARLVIEKHGFQENECPEPALVAIPRELPHARAARIRDAKSRNKIKAIDDLLAEIESQWPCLEPRGPSGQSKTFIKSHLKLKKAMAAVAGQMKDWYHNRKFSLYIEHIETIILAQPVVTLEIQFLHFEGPKYARIPQRHFVSSKDLFSSPPPPTLPNRPRLPPNS